MLLSGTTHPHKREMRAEPLLIIRKYASFIQCYQIKGEDRKEKRKERNTKAQNGGKKSAK